MLIFNCIIVMYFLQQSAYATAAVVSSFSCDTIYDPLVIVKLAKESKRQPGSKTIRSVSLQTGEPSIKVPFNSGWQWSWQLNATLVIGNLQTQIHVQDLKSGRIVNYKHRWSKSDFLFRLGGKLTFYRGESNTLSSIDDKTSIEVTSSTTPNDDSTGWNFDRKFASVSVINDEPCIIGGNDFESPIVCYTSSGSNWTEQSNIMVKRSKHHSIVHNNTLYVCGGTEIGGTFAEVKYPDTCALFNLQSGSMVSKRIPDYNTNEFMLFVMNNHVHIIGKSRSHTHVVKYDVDAGAKSHFGEYENVVGLLSPCYAPDRIVHSLLSSVENELDEDELSFATLTAYVKSCKNLIIFVLVTILANTVLHVLTMIDLRLVWRRVNGFKFLNRSVSGRLQIDDSDV